MNLIDIECLTSNMQQQKLYYKTNVYVYFIKHLDYP